MAGQNGLKGSSTIDMVMGTLALQARLAIHAGAAVHARSADRAWPAGTDVSSGGSIGRWAFSPWAIGYALAAAVFTSFVLAMRRQAGPGR